MAADAPSQGAASLGPPLPAAVGRTPRRRVAPSFGRATWPSRPRPASGLARAAQRSRARSWWLLSQATTRSADELSPVTLGSPGPLGGEGKLSARALCVGWSRLGDLGHMSSHMPALATYSQQARLTHCPWGEAGPRGHVGRATAPQDMCPRPRTPSREQLPAPRLASCPRPDSPVMRTALTAAPDWCSEPVTVARGPARVTTAWPRQPP